MSDRAIPGFWRTVRLLLKASRRRAQGQAGRQQQLLNNRSGRRATNWTSLGAIIGLVVMAALHGAAAYSLISAVNASQRRDAERPDKILVRKWFVANVQRAETAKGAEADEANAALEQSYSDEARHIVDRYGGKENLVQQRLRALVAASGTRNLITGDDFQTGLAALPVSGRGAKMLGSFTLLWWFLMVVCQGEGLELDLQRRRHPMWEWLLSHPVRPEAVFFAEMLSPVSANPTYWTAPLFVGILYGQIYDLGTASVAAVLIGVPLTMAAACLGKALEIGAVLRLPARSRGAFIGIVGWFGYVSMVAMFLGTSLIPDIVERFGATIDRAAVLPWPWLGLFLGLNSDGEFSFLHGLLVCWGITAALIAAAVIFCARSIRGGLSGAFASDQIPVRSDKAITFGRDPLHRKEYLWFVRDRSAIVQAILIPLTIAGFQMFNLRGILKHAQDSWNYLSGAAIFFGTYFLWVLGPKSLVSEGSALWLALTWPRGLEGILKAKARLWSTIATGLVTIILLAACWMFPQESWKIALVGVGWYLFSRSMAQKSVTLVTVVSESGEAQKVPSGRRWAAQLGMLTFAIGICTQTWSLAIVGIIYSWITAAAMWENLRARLPYLYDPWSERLPEPPTLMHAMVSISILIECASVLTAFFAGFGGRSSLAIAQGLGYAICAVGVSIGVSEYMSNRGVHASQIWCWRDTAMQSDLREPWIRRYVASDSGDLKWLLCGIGGGLALGVGAHLYLEAISLVPPIGEAIRASRIEMRSIPGMIAAYAIMAILFAPFAEEYLFRGLVFRTLDRQWGGPMAVLGAAAFFAIYHPPISWLPVLLVGATNCILFKKSRRLTPAVLLHATYNAVVISLG